MTRSIALLSIILLMSFLQTKAQDYKYVPFPDSNAVWSEVHWKSVFDPPPRWEYNQFALFNEDTIINGIKYHKLFHTNSPDKITRENAVCIGGLREDSLKRVLVNSSIFQVVPEIKEVVICDFSLNEGDTLHARYSMEICTNCFPPYYEIVLNVDTIKINNTYRRVITFDNYNRVTWIEGIGNLQGLLVCEPDWPTNGITKDLVCMHQNDTLLYYYPGTERIPYDDCVPSFVINDVILIPNPEIKVYPNPVTGGKVYFENLDFETLEIFNSIGTLIKKEPVKGLRFFELNISNLPPGAYSYKLKTNGLVPTQGKLIVQ